MLDEAGEALVEAAIAAAETATSAEIVCVLASEAGRYRATPLVVAGLIALALPLPLVLGTALPALVIYEAQVIAFAGLALALSNPGLRLVLTPRAHRRARAHEGAREQFLARGLDRTRGRRGVLIYVAVAERYVEVVPDRAVADALPAETWRAVVEDLVPRLRRGEIAPGLAEAVARVGERLSERFPPETCPDELPNRVVQL